MLSILPLVFGAAAADSGPWRWSEMFYPEIAAAVAQERHRDMVRAAERRRHVRGALSTRQPGQRSAKRSGR